MGKLFGSASTQQRKAGNLHHDSMPAIGGKTLAPPPFSLSAEPIQRVVNKDKNTEATIDDVFDYLYRNNIEFRGTKSDIIDSFEIAMESDEVYSIKDFVDEYVDVKVQKEDWDEACDEEKKGNQVSRTTAPQWVRDIVYSTDSSNTNYLGQDLNGRDTFSCPECDNPVTLDKNGKEVGYQNKHDRLNQPPVCHGDNFPAIYVNKGIQDIVNEEGLDSTLIKHIPEINKLVQDLMWRIGLNEMTPGHTKCNLSKKDTLWESLGGKKKKFVKDGIRTYLNNKSKYKKYKTIKDELCKPLSKKRKRDEENDKDDDMKQDNVKFRKSRSGRRVKANYTY
jgi:hypothetical protein